VHRRANVDQEHETKILGVAPAGGDQRSEPRARGPRHHGEVPRGGEHDGAGVPGAHQRIRLVAPEHLGGHQNGCARLSQDGFLRRLVHRDRLVRLHDLDAAAGVIVVGQERRNALAVAHEEAVESLRLRERERHPLHHGFGRKVAPHRVDGDPLLFQRERVHAVSMRRASKPCQ